MQALLLSFIVIFIAELGDKSQLMAMTFAARYRPWPILAGITAATAVVHALSVILGATAKTALPTTAITIAAGIAFLAFAAWTLRGDSLNEHETAKAATKTRSVFLAVSIAFFLAELGDKTMLATITLASREQWFGTWLGSTLGMVAADALAIAVGTLLAKKLPEKTIRYGAAALFAIFGIGLLIEALI